MNIERLRDQLKYDEGVKYEVYEDHLGYPTCGIGHLIKEDDEEYGKPLGAPVTEERVNALFEQDCNLAYSECEKLFGKSVFNSFNDELQEILINMMFNLGRTRLSKFKKFLAAIERRDWRTAAREGRDSLWYRQVTNRAERLMTRMANLS